jgi:hypothetical protein
MDEQDQSEEAHNGMEPEARRYLKKVLNSIFVGMFWLIAVMFFGIFLYAAFPVHGRIDGINIAFYIFFLVSLAGLVWYYYRMWK